MLLQVVVGLGLVFLLPRVARLFQVLVNSTPGFRMFFSMESLPANLLPPLPGITLGRTFLFRYKHKCVFESIGWDIHSLVSAWPIGTTLYLADAAVIKEVMTHRSQFPKPVRKYQVLTFFGPNIIASEGDLYKKYKKICAPAFSEPNNKLVWNETIGIVEDLLDSWANTAEVNVNDCLLELMQPLTLFVIGAAGFGHKMSWTENIVVPLGHKMTFRNALRHLSEGALLKLAAPRFVLKLTPSLRKIDLAFDELQVYMKEMIKERQTGAERHDLLSNLLAARDVDDDRFVDEEVIGNIFIFLLAGHETTAHTMTFTLALLALYPEVQEKLYKHVRSVIPEGTRPSYDHMPLLNYALAVVYETLRLFPSVVGIPKESSEDTTLQTTNLRGETLAIPVPKGTEVVISTPGLHYNPRYWKDPYDFRPSRFLGEWERDAFLPFSGGPRACLGRRFAEIESVAVLCMIVTHYEIEIKNEPEFAGESFEAKKERILRAHVGLSLTQNPTNFQATKLNLYLVIVVIHYVGPEFYFVFDNKYWD